AQVMAEMPSPRETYIHHRGNFENRESKVAPSIPSLLGSEGIEKTGAKKPDRLTLARQIVDSSNPLTARVIVNRIWQHHFGEGLVRTPGDFGVRADYPSHPELLDWLAVEFMESGWNVKGIHRLILNSATYQQSSRARQELIRLDSGNRYLARGSRHRLTGEQIRDVALVASGLLVHSIGGPSVFPPQPEGIGQFRDETAGKWVNDNGAKQYRKSIYTFWQRMSPFPSLVLFDAPSRERCSVKRAVTNTPLQSFVTLNDPHFAAIARKLGERIEDSSPDLREKIQNGFIFVLARFPSKEELAWFELFVKESEAEAWFQLAQVLLNLDEALTRE
ncbi:MAG: DUF1553 domain-containing protein, partial [Planctomycetota bacterium]|nr:DUF1553 domain-containing protein [Planctomycetota bacterium]